MYALYHVTNFHFMGWVEQWIKSSTKEQAEQPQLHTQNNNSTKNLKCRRHCVVWGAAFKMQFWVNWTRPQPHDIILEMLVFRLFLWETCLLTVFFLP
jgi:hypothetical protein